MLHHRQNEQLYSVIQTVLYEDGTQGNGCHRDENFGWANVLDLGESAASQCRPCRIQNDNNQMDALSRKIDEFCNPFGDNVLLTH